MSPSLPNDARNGQNDPITEINNPSPSAIAQSLSMSNVPDIYWCGTPWVTFSWTGGRGPPYRM